MRASIQKGDTFSTNSCGNVVVTKYVSCDYIIVQFPDKTKVVTRSNELRHGQVRNPNHPSYYGIGFIGIGPHSSKSREFRSLWPNMLRRCYDSTSGLNPTYTGCTVAKRWHNFQNFASDIEKMVGFGNEGWQLDKDILKRGNKVYGPRTCCFVPEEINKAFSRREAARGNLPIGVHLKDSNFYSEKPYKAICGVNNKQTHLGVFKTIREAFLAYKTVKEQEIQRLANKYRKFLDPKVYEALMKYRVKYTD